MKETVLEYLTTYEKQYTSVLYRIVGGKSSGYSLNEFRKYLHVLEDQGILKYIGETKESLPYWRLNK